MDQDVTASPAKSPKDRPPCKITYRSIFWLFMLGSVIGFILEGLWCIVRKGSWENHSATVWGPFCIIYGFGMVAMYLISVACRGKWLLQLVLFSAAGTLVEYFGSLFQEFVLGTKSWNYSKQFLNLGGRVSLQMTLLWGILGIAFSKFVFPSIEWLLNRMNGKFWKIVCVALSIFMAADLLVSALAIARWNDRLTDYTPPGNAVERFLDVCYGNGTMEKIYPNMKPAE